MVECADGPRLPRRSPPISPAPAARRGPDEPGLDGPDPEGLEPEGLEEEGLELEEREDDE